MKTKSSLTKSIKRQKLARLRAKELAKQIRQEKKKPAKDIDGSNAR